MSAADKIKRVWQSRREAIRSNRVKGETPDPEPIHVPGMSDRPLTLREEMRRFVRQELSQQAAEQGAGSFQDEDDFSEDEFEPDLISQYTVNELTDQLAPSDDLEGEPTPEDIESTPDSSVENPAAVAAPNPAPSPEPNPNEAGQ